jgi:hypothetical protein
LEQERKVSERIIADDQATFKLLKRTLSELHLPTRSQSKTFLKSTKKVEETQTEFVIDLKPVEEM